MSEFENAIPENEQELKDRTDEAIRNVGALPDEELGQVAGGSDDGAGQYDECTSQSKYACRQIQCDTDNTFDCASSFKDECLSYVYRDSTGD